MEKKSILILANDSTYVYNTRDLMLEKLIEASYNVYIACDILKRKEELITLKCNLIPTTFKRHSLNILSSVSLFFKYLHIIKEVKPEIVLTFNIKPNIFGGLACTIAKIPYLVNISGLGIAVETKGLIRHLTIFLYKFGVYHASCIFFQNHDNLLFFNQNNIANKNKNLREIPGSGVNLNRFRPAPYQESNVVNFLFVGRILKEKGIDLYVNAAKEIASRHNNVLFHICGYCDDDSYLTFLEELEQHPFIKYHGERNDLEAFYREAQCIIHPSYYPEGLSNVLLEACALCRPIITTDRPGCREVVVNGYNGYLIPTKDLNALVDAIEQFLSLDWNERKQMGLHGREFVERNFNREIVVNKYFKEINAAQST